MMIAIIAALLFFTVISYVKFVKPLIKEERLMKRKIDKYKIF